MQILFRRGTPCSLWCAGCCGSWSLLTPATLATLAVVLCVIKCLWVKMYPTPFIQLTIFIFSMSVDIYDIFLLLWTSFLKSSSPMVVVFFYVLLKFYLFYFISTFSCKWPYVVHIVPSVAGRQHNRKTSLEHVKIRNISSKWYVNTLCVGSSDGPW